MIADVGDRRTISNPTATILRGSANVESTDAIIDYGIKRVIRSATLSVIRDQVTLLKEQHADETDVEMQSAVIVPIESLPTPCSLGEPKDSENETARDETVLQDTKRGRDAGESDELEAAKRPLRILEPLILRHLGAILEGDIFSILASSPFIIRSSEFALSDGALDCTRSYGTTTSFAERFWSLVSHRPTDLSEIVLFDAKSSSVVDGDRIFYTSLGQRHGVGFYVCICGTDPDFVELIPNYQQKRAAFEPGFEVADEEQDIYTVNIQQVLRIDESMDLDFVGLQPCLAGFTLLPKSKQLAPQYFIQHKIEGRERPAGQQLTNVPVYRAGSHYFHTLDRVLIDSGGKWVNAVESIMRAYPAPRRPGDRPARPMVPGVVPVEDAVQTKKTSKAAKKASKQDRDEAERQLTSHLHKQAMMNAHRRFFYNFMAKCARSGLLVELARNAPPGDLGFCKYAWSKEEVKRYEQLSIMPQFAHTLPAETPR
ncbi:uncharacterized protein MYCGRDRAFT_97852 [Zymoseptoria tritici IPO323]|uniref:Uncharacterized protein n=1 Tax=Zymoseptoria tritici (strain CBS 115943 / IPO323) TaxID=336722 RepID=F9XRK6_ZYMTI|nr:uncharacterized protein MYCGRDRAFT_97852 [Zymoseptoria tritici IPO323]EGP82113.1 hypothetical protein MYCGRDRAFT_97852 [Zymoseptoria tritici IPO323]